VSVLTAPVDTAELQYRIDVEAERRRERGLGVPPPPDRVALAAHARGFARQGRQCPPLPDECVRWVQRLKDSDPDNGVRDLTPRAPLDHYLARLYYDAGWPAGALTRALDVASRDALHRRLRRVRDGRAGDCPDWVAELPCPPRPGRSR
jgi:hypothetical protein